MTSAATFSSTFTTLPREFCLDGSLFEDELRAIWDHQWIYMGRVSDIPEPGDFLVYDCDANWKVMLENYMECDHCSASHPEFCRTADLRMRAGDEYAKRARDEHPYWSTDVPPLARMKTASITGDYVCRVPLAGRDDFSRGESRSFGDWAGACVLYLYADHAMLHEIEPVSVTHTRFHLTWFVNADATDEDVDVEELVHVWDATTRQVELIERAQQGLRSRRYTPGPLSVRHEPYVHFSLNLYRAAMARAAH